MLTGCSNATTGRIDAARARELLVRIDQETLDNDHLERTELPPHVIGPWVPDLSAIPADLTDDMYTNVSPLMRIERDVESWEPTILRFMSSRLVPGSSCSLMVRVVLNDHDGLLDDSMDHHLTISVGAYPQESGAMFNVGLAMGRCIEESYGEDAYRRIWERALGVLGLSGRARFFNRARGDQGMTRIELDESTGLRIGEVGKHFYFGGIKGFESLDRALEAREALLEELSKEKRFIEPSWWVKPSAYNAFRHVINDHFDPGWCFWTHGRLRKPLSEYLDDWSKGVPIPNWIPIFGLDRKVGHHTLIRSGALRHDGRDLHLEFGRNDERGDLLVKEIKRKFGIESRQIDPKDAIRD